MSNVSYVKRDRVGVLASTIVRELAGARIKAIETDAKYPVEPPITTTSKLRAILKSYDDARRAQGIAEKAIRIAGYRIGTDEDDKAVLEWPYRSRDKEKEERRKFLADRCNKVRELRTSVLIDLVALDEATVKQVITKYRKALDEL